MKGIFFFGLLILISCDIPIKPDYVKNGKEYIIREVCVKSHTEETYDYHFGYNYFSGKHEYHYGPDSKTICDSSVIDTIEVNVKKKYYKKIKK